MDIIKFRAFCTVAELHSISKAAEKLYYTQPAISTQIRGLETEYGARLFRRSGKRIELTEAGSELLPIAEQVLKLFEESANAVRRAAAIEDHHVHVGASAMPGVHIVPELIARFKEKHPEYLVAISIANAYQLERMMAEGEVDLGIFGRAGPIQNPGRFMEIELFEDPLVLVVGNHHPLANLDSLKAEQLNGESMILPPHRILTRISVDERLKQLDVQPRLAFEIANSEAIKRMVINHLGISIMCASVVKAEADAGWLKVIPIQEFRLARKVYLSYPKEKESNPAIKELVAFIKTVFQV